MSLIKIPTINTNLTIGATQTFLTVDTASGVSSITVKNITGFAINQILVIGEIGNEGSEIIKTHTATAPTGSTITLAAATVFPHSAGTQVIVINFDQIEFSTATTSGGSKTVLATNSIVADSITTNYNDTTVSTGYYFARFKNSITSIFSSYSSAIPVGGYTSLMARSIIDNALQSINKTTSTTLSDEFGFNQLNNCTTEVIRELKRWSFLQKFNFKAGTVTTGTWKVALPSDCDDQNTNRSIYNVRIGTDNDLVWVDKEKWATTSGGTPGAALPTSSDAVFFDANSTTNCVCSGGGAVAASVDFTGYTKTFSGGSACTISGNLTMANTFTLTHVGRFIFNANATITSNGVAFGTDGIEISGSGITVQLADDFSSASLGGDDGISLRLTQGTFNANNKNVSIYNFLSNNSSTRTLTMGSGLWSLTGVDTADKVWNTDTTTNLTLTATTSTIKYTNTSNTGATFRGHGTTFNNLWFSRGASTATNVIDLNGASPTLTFNDLKDNGTGTHTFTLPTSLNLSTFNVSGTAGHLITMSSTTNLIVPSGIVSVDYLALSNNTINGGLTAAYAGANSTNGGSNVGWTFTAAPSSGGSFLFNMI